MKKLLIFVCIVSLTATVSLSCIAPAKSDNKAEKTAIITNNNISTDAKVQIDSIHPDSVCVSVKDAGAAQAPALSSWIEKLFNKLKWIIPGLIILFRLIPTKKNLDIIALLNWVLDYLIPNLQKTGVGTVEQHQVKKSIAERTPVGRLLNKLFGL
jgi:hypothetical protein